MTMSKRTKGAYFAIKNKVLGIFFLMMVVVSPFVFTRPCFISKLDFTSTGQIGDTIGGITAPVIGSISVFLLYLTLIEQVTINREQKRYNDINRAISMQTQIIQMCIELEFKFSDNNRCQVGRGLQSLGVLARSYDGVKICSSSMRSLIDDVHTIGSSINIWVFFLRNSDMYAETKSLSANIAATYLRKIKSFYCDVKNRRIVYVCDGNEQFNDVFGDKNFDSQMSALVEPYIDNVETLLKECEALMVK